MAGLLCSVSNVLLAKMLGVRIYRGDLVREEDDPGWQKQHPVGPVHVRVVCKDCGAVLASDLHGYGWLEKDSFWKERIVPHFLLTNRGTKQ